MTTTTFTTSIIADSYDPIFSFAASGDTLIVNEGVTLANQEGYVVDGRGGLHDLTAIINGTLSAPYPWVTLDAFSSSIALTVGGTGRIESDGTAAFEASADSSLANHGTLHARYGFGAVISDADGASVENWGTIFGEVGAVYVAGTESITASIVNHGLLEAGGGSEDRVWGNGANQAVYSSAGTTSIVNDGVILAADKVGAGIMLGWTPSGAVATVENSGTIESARYWGIFAREATLDISNSGTIRGGKGSLSLTSGSDTVTNDGLLDGRAMLGGGNDAYHGEGGRVIGPVWGQAGDDVLAGGAVGDILGGGSGNDTISGGMGNDVLTGAAGTDVLYGGTGDDVFRFAQAGDAKNDRIAASRDAPAFEGAGLAGGDRIDVSAIDANLELAGHQHFSFGTTHGVGELWAANIVGEVTYIRGNTDGTGAPEFELVILDGVTVQASDFIL